MKILIVLIRYGGGVGSANKAIAKALRDKGHHVDMLAREDDLGKYSLKESFWSLRKRVKQLMKEKNYDIIYVQDYSCLIPILFPFPLAWKKTFYASIGVKWKPGIQKTVQDVLGRVMGRKTIVLFHHNKKRFPKSNVVYRGVDPEKFKPLKKKRQHFGWINKFSDMGDKKAYEDAAKKLGLKPLYVGDWSKTNSKGAAYNKKMEKSFSTPHDQMNDFYNKCQVFINLATPDAGFNLSWLEAMASGVPIVIGNDHGAGPMLPFDKILDHENNLEEQIVKIVKNPKKVDYRQWLVDHKLTWSQVADELLSVFAGKKTVLNSDKV